MIKFVIFVLVATLLHCTLVTATGSPKQDSEQNKRLKLDLNLSPPEEDTNEQASLHISHVNVRSAQQSNTQFPDSGLAPAQPKDCKVHHPGCDHWDSIPRKDKKKAYYHWRKERRTEEQIIAERKSSSIRSKKRYDGLTEQERKLRGDQSMFSRKRKLESMNAEERKAWYKKNNSYRRKPKQAQTPPKK
ncbi:uncharacterized protein FA14DRAFT_156323 [Meira miltonrushii]|uniref:Uncharacterized protein n=1 Tax=Meira miltonrushii TaxID=1280837 RepID=A0A316VDV3_9BASI|nr:uncharacterized protein FA14DRAFT_156323 [Meira miltonrushii]PWN33635.1 hypothetical protein FA14DRAFT_156323 [Meira miltonrushii]